MRMSYEERKQAKIERYKELAHKYSAGSRNAYERSNQIASWIPFGQPILVGHHSEARHRRDIERIHNAMDQSVELANKSEEYAQRAKNLENHHMISSDDPEAIAQLKEKLERLYKLREKIKARPHQTYELSNLSGNIRSVKERISHLESLSKVEAAEWVFGDNKVLINKDLNRVQVFFPGKPSEEVRTKLKQNGFRWSHYEVAWQRHISRWALDIAKEIAGGELK
jgi:hypothetical protein